jgi:signal transduction histidine kinase
MNSILGFTELLKDIDLSHEKQQAFLEIIEKSVARMLHIISDIVEFSSIESGQMKVYLSETNVNQEIENIYAFFIPEAEYKGIRLFTRKTLPTSQASIQTDRDKFYAIMSNLMNNAIKFTQSGSIEIGYVKTDDYWEFYVKDTGIGVTETQKEFIFNRFRQGSESENKKYEGAGLGLSISKAYVEALGGRIWVESHPESKYYKGSAFYFTLPSMAGNENQPRGRRLSELR